jgi:hypothetical protein
MSLEHFECKKGTSNSAYFLHMMNEFMSVLVSSMVTVTPEVRGKGNCKNISAILCGNGIEGDLGRDGRKHSTAIAMLEISLI